MVFLYNKTLKPKARLLRKQMTESEHIFWSSVRGKQIDGVQFYRQKPIGRYIVDFYAPSANLVVEIDGSQHMENPILRKDTHRDNYLQRLGLMVLRFNSREVCLELEGVLKVLQRTIATNLKSPHPPLFQRGEQ